MVSISEIRKFALSMPNTVEKDHQGKTSFRVNNKIYLIIQNDKQTITVKTTYYERELLVNMDPNKYRIPDTFTNLNYMHVNIKKAKKEEVINLIRSAWGHVAPRKLFKSYFGY